MTARVGLVDRDEVLAAYDRLWEDDTGRFLLLCGPPGGGLTSVIRHLWRSEKRRRALVDLGGFPADQRLLARALLGQLLPDRKVTSAPAKNEQLQRARSFGQIIWLANRRCHGLLQNQTTPPQADRSRSSRAPSRRARPRQCGR
jgi:hypothetical protein